jgi:maltooligosyltrehalose trehalohydrolase
MFLWCPFYRGAKAGEWGDDLNFDGEGAAGVREFFIANAAYWIRELHLDGFRVDATQAIHDTSEPHIIAEIAQTARAAGRGGTTTSITPRAWPRRA